MIHNQDKMFVETVKGRIKTYKVPLIGKGADQRVDFLCPGCNQWHSLSMLTHTWNGDYYYPTFTPSVLDNFKKGEICHSFVTGGKIQFLNDCTHDLAGLSMELPIIEKPNS